jgi:membrane protease YdiL (CAAX protease family)
VLSSLDSLLANPALRALAPLPVLAALAPGLVRVFRADWFRFEEEAQRARASRLAAGQLDVRPAAAFAITAVALTLQQYYGGVEVYDQAIFPWLSRLGTRHAWLQPDLFRDLYSFVWWSFARCATYALLPLIAWKVLFPRDRLLDLGLRAGATRGDLRAYAWCLLAVAPVVALASREPEFAAYYPFYSLASRSRLDLAVWEALYVAQFFALEFFFRGFLLAATRASLGAGAIFAMCVPYCMIHYGKPYLEANAALVAGVVLGTLAMRTRSIYGGFVVHVVVALGMDALALTRRGGLPASWAPW